MPAIARAMARRKGFTLARDSRSNEYRLIDDGTHLPELNPANGTFLFSLSEAVAFLDPLHDRALASPSTN
jgi:hypothetical protein